MRKRSRAVLLAAVACIVSCAGYFVAEYSESVDNGAAKLQRKIDRFLVDLEHTSGTPEGEYARHAGFYEDVRGDIQEIRGAASLQRGNDLTIQSLDLIEKNVAKLEEMHAGGISPREIAVVRTLFDTQLRMLVQLENAKKRKES